MTLSEIIARRRVIALLEVLALVGEVAEEIGPAQVPAFSFELEPAMFDELHRLDRADSRLAARASVQLSRAALSPSARRQLRRFQRRWLKRFPRLLTGG